MTGRKGILVMTKINGFFVIVGECVIASLSEVKARQSFTLRLLRHFIPRNDRKRRVPRNDRKGGVPGNLIFIVCNSIIQTFVYSD